MLGCGKLAVKSYHTVINEIGLSSFSSNFRIKVTVFEDKAFKLITGEGDKDVVHEKSTCFHALKS